jgi:predicted Zn-dependent protease
MSGVDRPRELFRVLNDLPAGAKLTPGTKLKIVNDS